MAVQVDVAEPSKSYRVGTDEVRYQLRVKRVPLVDHLKGRLYHWYDMRIPNNIPGWGRFERLLEDWFGAEMKFGIEGEGEPRWRDRIVTWKLSQDFRCYYLNAKGEHLCDMEIDQETHDAFEREDH